MAFASTAAGSPGAAAACSCTLRAARLESAATSSEPNAGVIETPVALATVVLTTAVLDLLSPAGVAGLWYTPGGGELDAGATPVPAAQPALRLVERQVERSRSNHASRSVVDVGLVVKAVALDARHLVVPKRLGPSCQNEMTHRVTELTQRVAEAPPPRT